jgi:murein DD-endopeptidase MepM/ murein hydrolase activator NlpD
MHLSLSTVRRRTVGRPRLSVLASTLAMSTALTTWIGGAAIADGAQAAVTAPAGVTTTDTTTAPATTVTATTTAPPTTTTTATTTTTTPATTTAPTTTTTPATTTATTTTTTTTPATTTATTTTTPPAHSPGAKRRSARKSAPHKRAARKTHSQVSVASKSATKTTASAAAVPATTGVFSPVLGASPSTSSALGSLTQVIGGSDFPPSYLIPIYKAAGQRYHIPWQILAAINGVETNYGRNLSVSSAGAVGWMQFMPATWSEYAVSAGGTGKPNPYNPSDAIFAAARLLAANGGAHNIRAAVFAYNHASWYVDAVIWRGQLISDWAAKNKPLNGIGYALPLDAKYLEQLGRTDEGVDIETAPDGAAVYSITPGVVTAVASDPSGFGPNYPVIRVTSGALAGHYIYYGHVAASLVHVGQRVGAGQPIAVMGHTGDAAGLGHGHIEIGFSDASGNPLNHPGTAATASGSAMRSFLIELSGASGIRNS